MPKDNALIQLRYYAIKVLLKACKPLSARQRSLWVWRCGQRRILLSAKLLPFTCLFYHTKGQVVKDNFLQYFHKHIKNFIGNFNRRYFGRFWNKPALCG